MTNQSPEFELHLEGPGLSPESLDICELFAVLQPVRDLIVALSDSELPLDRPVLSLLAVHEGSVGLACQVHKPFRKSLVAIGEHHRHDDWASTAPPVRRAYSNLVSELKRSGRTLAIPFSSELSVIVTGDHQLPKREPKHVIRGGTTVLGEVIRIGGDPSVIELKTAQGDKISAKASREMCREVADRLYEFVAISGEAEFSTDSMEIQRFTAEALLPYRATGIGDAFAALRKKYGETFNDIDPEHFVGDLRSE